MARKILFLFLPPARFNADEHDRTDFKTCQTKENIFLTVFQFELFKGRGQNTCGKKYNDDDSFLVYPSDLHFSVFHLYVHYMCMFGSCSFEFQNYLVERYVELTILVCFLWDLCTFFFRLGTVC